MVATRQIGSVSFIPSAAHEADPSRLPRGVASLPTRELLEAAVNSGYTGPEWEELGRRLVDRALPDLEKAIQAGTIYRRCRRAGCAISPNRELQRPPVSQDIAAEAVEDCLERFKDQVLPAGDWDPNRGTSLEDFFSACCIPHIANRWRWHLRQLPLQAVELDALDEPGQAGVLALVTDPPPDPADVIEARDQLARTAAQLSLDDQRFFLLKEQGWSPAEIAQILGVDRNTLDARISRARKAARARRTR
jgi:DNA-directed RNA polymerase specialized sigma24 family protein